jgi:ribosomal protein S6E (S10)
MKHTFVFFPLGLLAAAAVAGGSIDSVAPLTAGVDGSIKVNSTSSASSGSSARFTGKNGRVSVNGDLVQARDGVLTVNGVSYGTVDEKSVVQYTVRDGEKILTVDGVPRKPLNQ